MKRTRLAFAFENAFDRLRRGKRRVGDVERLPGYGGRCVTRRATRLVRSRARRCAGWGKTDGSTRVTSTFGRCRVSTNDKE